MSCSFYTFRQNDYYCMKKQDYVNSDTYYRYCRNYSYDECPIYKHEEDGPCYLTTVVCSILKARDDCYVLEILRGFRDNVLQKDPKYYDILKRYDAIGPIVSEKIINDKNRLDVATNLYYHSLKPICKYIKVNEFDKAISLYTEMTLSLIDGYGLKEKYDNIDLNDNNFNLNSLGHGRVLTNKD